MLGRIFAFLAGYGMFVLALRIRWHDWQYERRSRRGLSARKSATPEERRANMPKPMKSRDP